MPENYSSKAAFITELIKYAEVKVSKEKGRNKKDAGLITTIPWVCFLFSFIYYQTIVANILFVTVDYNEHS